MKFNDAVFLTLLSISMGINLWQYLRAKKGRFKETFDATMLLHDLTRGNALVKVTRVAPEDVILRSPRGVA